MPESTFTCHVVRVELFQCPHHVTVTAEGGLEELVRPVGHSGVHALDMHVLQQMVQELLDMFGLPEDTPVTIPGFHYRDPTLADPGVLTLRQALTSCYDIRCVCGSQAFWLPSCSVRVSWALTA